MISAIIIFALFAWVASPRAVAETTAFESMLLEGSARTSALGGAYVALARGAYAPLINPAGVAGLSYHEVLFSHLQHIAGSHKNIVGYGSPWNLGGMASFFDSGVIKRATISNPDGYGLGTTSLRDLILTFSCGQEFFKRISVGASAKYFREAIDGAVIEGGAADFGVLVRDLFKSLSLGAAVRNFGPPIRFHETREKLPSELRVGAAYTQELQSEMELLGVVDAIAQHESWHPSGGLELLLASRMALRLGHNGLTDDGPGVTAGFGLRGRNLYFDYTLTPLGFLGISHYIDISLRWGARP